MFFDRRWEHLTDDGKPTGERPIDNAGIAFVDRQVLQGKGWAWSACEHERLHLTFAACAGWQQQPASPVQRAPTPTELVELDTLKQTMVAAHPDKATGSHQAFIEARARYEAARTKVYGK